MQKKRHRKRDDERGRYVIRNGRLFHVDTADDTFALQRALYAHGVPFLAVWRESHPEHIRTGEYVFAYPFISGVPRC